MANTVGIGLYAHYCGGELEEVSVFSPKKQCCTSENNADPCCKNEAKLVHIEDSFVKTASSDTPVKFQQLLSFTYCFAAPLLFSVHTSVKDFQYAVDFSPPRRVSIPILIQSFRI